MFAMPLGARQHYALSSDSINNRHMGGHTHTQARKHTHKHANMHTHTHNTNSNRMHDITKFGETNNAISPKRRTNHKN